MAQMWKDKQKVLEGQVDQVVADGPGLVFVVFPHALAQMPCPHLWSVVFFCLVLFLGVDSQFATVEVILTSIKDGWQNVNEYDLLLIKLRIISVCYFLVRSTVRRCSP